MDAKPAIIHTTTKRHAAEQNTYTPFVQHHVLIGQRLQWVLSRHVRCGFFLPFWGHNLNISHPISNVIALSGKWSCRYLPESQRRKLNQGKNK